MRPCFFQLKAAHCPNLPSQLNPSSSVLPLVLWSHFCNLESGLAGLILWFVPGTMLMSLVCRTEEAPSAPCCRLLLSLMFELVSRFRDGQAYILQACCCAWFWP